jgi:hypothetical protein
MIEAKERFLGGHVQFGSTRPYTTLDLTARKGKGQ